MCSESRNHPLRSRAYRVIFGTDTPAGKLLDVVLIWSILASVGAVMLDSDAAHWKRCGTRL